MRCYNCGSILSEQSFCTSCGVDVTLYKKIIMASNRFYNDGLTKANVRDLSGAIVSLRQSLKFNKNNIEARNLLGLVYFEMGEVCAALSEWVISKNIRPAKNVANTYIDMVQSNTSKLDTINQSIKKYNQALAYCQQDCLDLAVIQLKKVLSMTPKFIRAHQLLALLYINDEEWEKAKRECDKCLAIDKGNTLSLRYLKEIDKMMMPDEGGAKNQTKNEEVHRYRSDNEIIIQPANVKEPRSGMGASVLLYIAIGIALGSLATFFLIRPGIISSEQSKYQEEVRGYGEQLDAKTAQITELTSQVENLKEETESLHGQLDGYVGEGGTIESIDKLLTAATAYIANPNDIETISPLVQEIANEVDIEATSDAFKELYSTVLKTVGPGIAAQFYETGYQYFGNDQFEQAIDELEQAVFYDEENLDALFLLGNAYRRAKNDEKAAETYQAVIDKFPGTERAKRAEEYLGEING